MYIAAAMQAQDAPPTQDTSSPLQQSAADCFLSALLAVGRHMADLCPHIGVPYQEGLLRLRQRLAFSATTEGLAEALAALETDLGEFGTKTSDYFHQKTDDVSQILAIVEKASDTLESRDEMYQDRLGHIAADMEAALNSSTVDIKEAYVVQLDALKKFMLDMSKEGNASFANLRDEVHDVQQRLERAHAEATIDPVTGLVKRHELERQIRKRVEQEKQFCVLLFAIKDFASVTHRFGNSAGDQLLRQFGAKLVAQVRPRDVVARWGDYQFAVVFECSARDAGARAQQIAQWISGRYIVPTEDRERKVEIDAELAVAEKQADDSVEDLARRAEGLLPGSNRTAAVNDPAVTIRWRPGS